MRRVLRLGGSVLRGVALLGLLAFLVSSSVTMTLRGFFWVRAASAGGDLAEIRRRVWGAAWTDGIAAIRRTIPPDGEYLLVNGQPGALGAPYWVRYELAPRRARFLGELRGAESRPAFRRQLADGPEWVVVAFQQPRPPLMVRRRELQRAVELRHGPP